MTVFSRRYSVCCGLADTAIGGNWSMQIRRQRRLHVHGRLAQRPRHKHKVPSSTTTLEVTGSGTTEANGVSGIQCSELLTTTAGNLMPTLAVADPVDRSVGFSHGLANSWREH